ncbi:peptidase [Streptomyces sp. NPDC088910]|uniref:peptidase n=1 Tax=Streptomyces sp. NPDC088910 TaxID=3365911 RepID=UPI0038009C74
MSRTRAGFVVAGIAAGAVVMTGAPAAQAATVNVNYHCKTPIGDKSAVSPIDIAATPSGSSYRLKMTFQKGVSSSPIELGKGAMNPHATILLGGADSGSLTVTGPSNPAPIPANTPIKITDLSGTYTPKASGKVTFTPGVLTILALGTTTTCTADPKPGVSLTLTVKAAGGSSGSGGSSASGGTTGSGGSSGSGGTSGGSSGNLAQTGSDDGVVALGTLGGTVLLFGAGGALWLTRRTRRRV